MKKVITSITLIAIIASLAGIIILNAGKITSFSVLISNQEKADQYSYTKAICNKTNYCQDYEIICEGSETIEVSLIENSGRQYPASWKDTRTDEQKNKQCE